MRVYVSGPMTGYPGLNYPAFHEAAAVLRTAGHDVVSPAEINPVDAEGVWADFLRKDIVELLTCDTICMLDGWMESKGARLEHYIASALGMTVLNGVPA